LPLVSTDCLRRADTEQPIVARLKTMVPSGAQVPPSAESFMPVTT
jgi:hypothetical protein